MDRGPALQTTAILAGLAVVLAACSGAPPAETLGTTSSAIFPNDQAAYDYFVGKGLTSFQAAGIVGNLDQESGVDPLAVQSGGPGRGIAQWSVGGRWDTDANDNAEAYATMEGQSVDSLQLQLDFIWYELTTFSGYGLAALKATTNVTNATIAFETDFEGCGMCDQSTRVTYAEAVLSAYGTDSGVVVPLDSGDGVGTPCTVTATGESGICRDTSTCAALGGVSTADYCPGPSNVQCCTGTPDAGHDAGTHSGVDAGSHSGGDAGSHSGADAGNHSGVDAGSHSVDGGSRTGIDAAAVDGGYGDVRILTSNSGGCAMSPGTSLDGRMWLPGIGLAAIALRRRRRRHSIDISFA